MNDTLYDLNFRADIHRQVIETLRHLLYLTDEREDVSDEAAKELKEHIKALSVIRRELTVQPESEDSAPNSRG